VLAAIDAREKRIVAELTDADAKRAEARKDKDEFQQKNEEFDRQRASLIATATDEAGAERQRLLEEARKVADGLSARRQAALISDAHSLNEAILQRTGHEVFAIARKALTDLADTSLEQRLSAVFIRRLREMDANERKLLGEALQGQANPAVVRSTFEQSVEQRTAIQNALNETFSADIHIRFETSPDLISGIELAANGQKVTWSIADYLTSMEKGINELLVQNASQSG